jgi:hypothetical protein
MTRNGVQLLLMLTYEIFHWLGRRSSKNAVTEQDGLTEDSNTDSNQSQTRKES